MRRLIQIFGLSITGSVAAIGFFLLSPFLARHSGDGFAGLIFGIALALYFSLFHKVRSIWKASAMTASSTLAYNLAVMASFHFYEWSFQQFDRNPANYGNFPPYVLFPGGFVGAFCICGTALVLYSPQKRSLVIKTLLCSVGQESFQY